MDDKKSAQREYKWLKDLRKICGSGEDITWFENNVYWKMGSGKNNKWMWEVGTMINGNEYGLEKRMIWIRDTLNWNVLERHS